MEEVNAQEWLRKFWENKNNERGLDLQQKKIHSETTEEFASLCAKRNRTKQKQIYVYVH